ncbi:hypothetical protein [Sodalis sp. RH25]|uniref:hypothetical protein n=1 Tax=Sodalis sp. RH25 TaxID=3394340 RepID=UPI0039B5CC64
MPGLAVAIRVGVPLGLWIGQLFSWHIVFAFVGAVGLVTCLLIARFVPCREGDDGAHQPGRMPFVSHLVPRWMRIWPGCPADKHASLADSSRKISVLSSA